MLCSEEISLQGILLHCSMSYLRHLDKNDEVEFDFDEVNMYNSIKSFL